MEEAPADADGEGRRGGFLAAMLLRALDRGIALLQRWREHIAPSPSEDDDAGSRRTRSHTKDETAEPTAPAAPARHLSAYLLVLIALLAGTAAGSAASYRLLSKMIRSNEVVIEDLRDGVARLEKEDALNQTVKAKYLRRIAEDEKEMREYQAAIDSCRNRVEELRKSPPTSIRAGVAGPGMAAAGRDGQRQARVKSGTCATGPNLARCIEEFNRR